MNPELLLQLYISKEVQIDHLLQENNKLKKEIEKLKAEQTLKDNEEPEKK